MVQENIEMDMTPMIDCVFLLMIFFVLVIDLSQKNLEDLILPRAEFMEPDESPPESRPIINILQNGTVVYGGDVYFDPYKDNKNYKKIAELLLDIRTKGLNEGTLHLVDKNTGGMTWKVIDDPILIRADKWTEWFWVGEIMKQCSQPEIAFWKVQLALSEHDRETGAERMFSRGLESKLDAFLPFDTGETWVVEEPGGDPILSEEGLSIKIHVESKGTPTYKEGEGAGLVNPNTDRPFRFVLKGHKLRWEVGTKPLGSIEAVKAELNRIAQDPIGMIPDKKTGGKKLISCLIQAYPGTCYDDVVTIHDAANAAGFQEVNFGGGLGFGK